MFQEEHAVTGKGRTDEGPNQQWVKREGIKYKFCLQPAWAIPNYLAYHFWKIQL